MEGEEGDRDRQRHFDEADIELNADRAKGVHQRGCKEIVIFEIAEQAEIGGDREPQHREALGAILETVDQQRRAVIEHRADQQ